MDRLLAVIGFILALSIASERLVEIIKGLIPFLNKQNPNITKEGIRRSTLQILSVLSGILTSFLAKESLPSEMNNLSIFIIGLLASGGSGFWNAILTYVTGIKDLQKVEIESSKQELLPPQQNNMSEPIHDSNVLKEGI